MRTFALNIREQLIAAFSFMSLLIALVAGIAVAKQFDTIERAALLEAQNIAVSIAYTGVDDVLNKPEFLSNYLAGMDKLYQRDIIVVDAGERVVASADSGTIGSTYSGDDDGEVGQTIRDGKTRSFRKAPTAEAPGRHEVVVALRRDQGQDDSPIVGAVVLEFTKIYAELVDAALVSIYFEIFMGVVAVAFALVFGIQVALRISSRLRSLESAVKGVADGNYATRIAPQREDEIGELGSAFNRMAETLGATHHALLDHSRLLEERVEARTLELAKSNELLDKEMQEHKISAARNETLAYYDSLTGLPNRSLFNKLLEHNLANARRYGKSFGVLFIDLDRFKNINDSLGHEGGNALLQEAAKRIGACMRTSDVVARLGGDEFVVLVSEMENVANVEIIARKILIAISKPCTLMGQEFSVTASIGISSFPADGRDGEALLKTAESAMYQAKEDGKNNSVVYSSTRSINSLQRLALETSMRHALERHQFEVYYQSKVDSDTGMISGAEALLRWNHPDLGLVSPLKFIPLAEETGQIVDIGRWVLRSACAQNMAWSAAGHGGLVVAVNLSARQFADPNLLADIQQALDDTGMPPNLLELEITESMLMQNVDNAMRIMTAIKARNIRLAIDDFGTGYSSLSTLKRFPLDTIKIDRSFIQDIPVDADDIALTRAIINMGKSLDLTVVAEGVETSDQRDFLRQNACDVMQGYFFSKPVKAEAFSGILRDQKARIVLSNKQMA